MKFWLHRPIVSYRNSPTPLILFLNFENCAREKVLKLIFSIVSTFSLKNKAYKMGLCVCVRACARACVCVPLSEVLVRPNNFQTIYPIDNEILATYSIVPELSNAINPVS